MQNERSGARRQHKSKKDEEVLSPQAQIAHDRGRVLKQYLRAAAALNDLYDDTALGEAVGMTRAAVKGWWTGAQMKPDTLGDVARITRLSVDQLMSFVYRGGPPPTLPDPANLPVLEGIRQARELLADEAPGTPSSLPEQRHRGTEAGRG